MTGAQRLRLVLALGVVNLVLATVALGVGITSAPEPQIAVVEPTAPPTIVTPGAESTPRPGATPAEPAPSGTPPGPGPSSEPAGQPSPVVPPVTPSAEPSPSVAPSPSPATEPSVQPSVAPSGGPVLAGGPQPNPAVAPGSNDGAGKPPSPKPTPTPTTPTPVTAGTSPCHASDQGFASSDGKACVHQHDNKGKKADKAVHHDNGRHTGHQAGQDRRHGQHQPATVESPRRSQTSRHRLRTGRRAR